MKLFTVFFTLLVACFVVTSSLAQPTVEGKRGGLSVQQADISTANNVRILAPTVSGTLSVSGWDSRQVKVEVRPALSEKPTCAVEFNQKEKTFVIFLKTDYDLHCNAAMNLAIKVPRSYDVTIIARAAQKVELHDLGGLVAAEVSPELSVFTGSHQTAYKKVDGSTFRIKDLRGAFVMSAAEMD